MFDYGNSDYYNQNCEYKTVLYFLLCLSWLSRPNARRSMWKNASFKEIQVYLLRLDRIWIVNYVCEPVRAQSKTYDYSKNMKNRHCWNRIENIYKRRSSALLSFSICINKIFKARLESAFRKFDLKHTW